MSDKRTNYELLKEISSELTSVSREVARLREAIKEAHADIIKLNMIEDKIKKGEQLVEHDNDGWFWWSTR